MKNTLKNIVYIRIISKNIFLFMWFIIILPTFLTFGFTPLIPEFRGYFDLVTDSSGNSFMIEKYTGDYYFRYRSKWIFVKYMIRPSTNFKSIYNNRYLFIEQNDENKHDIIFDMFTHEPFWIFQIKGDRITLPNGPGFTVEHKFILKNITMTPDSTRLLQLLYINSKPVDVLWDIEKRNIKQILLQDGLSFTLADGTKETVKNSYRNWNIHDDSIAIKKIILGKNKYQGRWSLKTGELIYLEKLNSNELLNTICPQIIKKGDNLNVVGNIKVKINSVKKLKNPNNIYQIPLLVRWKRYSSIMSIFVNSFKKIDNENIQPLSLSDKFNLILHNQRIIIWDCGKNTVLHVVPKIDDKHILHSNTEPNFAFKKKDIKNKPFIQQEAIWSFSISNDGKYGCKVMDWGGKKHTVLLDLEKGRCMRVLLSEGDKVTLPNGRIINVSEIPIQNEISHHGKSVYQNIYEKYNNNINAYEVFMFNRTFDRKKIDILRKATRLEATSRIELNNAIILLNNAISQREYDSLNIIVNSIESRYLPLKRSLINARNDLFRN